MHKLLTLLLLLTLFSCAHKSVEKVRTTSSNDSCFSLFESFQRKILTPLEKARSINDLDGLIKGSFAEIGAGQDVSGTFFKAKKASGTVVKTISAYGKEESNRLYGDGQRFVSKQRLISMLETEFGSLRELESQFEPGTRLFSYSNSVTTNKNGSGHGWIGIRFQVNPSEDPIDILIHANFAKSPVLTQHKEVGKMGVNLIHGAMTPQRYSPDNVLVSLLDQLKKGSLDIDYIDFSKGSLNSSKSALELIKNGLTKNVLLDNSEAYVPKDLFYKKAIYVGVDSQYFSELDSIAIKQTDSTSSTVMRSLQDGKKIWITKETDLFNKFRFLDQGMGLEVFYKISHQELNELSDSNLKGFIRKLGSLNNSFKFSFQDDPSLLKPEAKKLLSRLVEKKLLID